jgi:hypothetical protein
MYVCI